MQCCNKKIFNCNTAAKILEVIKTLHNILQNEKTLFSKLKNVKYKSNLHNLP